MNNQCLLHFLKVTCDLVSLINQSSFNFLEFQYECYIRFFACENMHSRSSLSKFVTIPFFKNMPSINGLA